MCKIEIPPHLLAMFGFVVCAKELWIHLIKRGWWMFDFVQNWPAVDFAEQIFVASVLSGNPQSSTKTFWVSLCCLGLSATQIGKIAALLGEVPMLFGGVATHRWIIKVAIGMMFWCAC
jgi:hypothetical protein